MKKNILEITKGPFRSEIIEGLHRAEYDAINGLNPSSIVKRKKSALHCRHAYEEGFRDSEAMRFGRCCHAMLLEPDTFQDRWIPWDGASYGKNFDKFADDHPGKEFIKTEGQQYTLSHAMNCVNAALKKPQVRELVSECVTEVAVLTEEFGMQCKGLMDGINTSRRGARIIDPKFTTDIGKHKFGMSAGSFLYHVKMACYVNWFQRVTNKEVEGVYFIAIETVPPHDVAVVPIEPLILEDGWKQARELMELISNDVHSNQFHGVDEGATFYELELPYHALHEEEIHFAGAEVMEIVE